MRTQEEVQTCGLIDSRSAMLHVFVIYTWNSGGGIGNIVKCVWYSLPPVCVCVMTLGDCELG
jgi:hypothetical protein